MDVQGKAGRVILDWPRRTFFMPHQDEAQGKRKTSLPERFRREAKTAEREDGDQRAGASCSAVWYRGHGIGLSRVQKVHMSDKQFANQIMSNTI